MRPEKLYASQFEPFVGEVQVGKLGSKRKQVKGGWSQAPSPPETSPRNAGRRTIVGYT